MPLPGHHWRPRRASTLLARYSETLGELTLRRQSEIASRAARQEAELNSRSKSAFLSAMSHELRTPLNAIIGFSDLLRVPEPVGSAERSEYAEHIASAGRRLLDAVNGVLDMSRLESGGFALSCAPLPLGDVIEEALAQVRPQFDEKRQQVDVHLARGLPQIEADVARVRQLLTYLLSNASKFTAAGGRILVMTRAGADGGITIAVADTGIGMTHEEIMLALNPFTQVDARRARAQEGLGLGLPLAHGIARLHGGSLHIESQPGHGTSVIVTLPSRAVVAPRRQEKAA